MMLWLQKNSLRAWNSKNYHCFDYVLMHAYALIMVFRFGSNHNKTVYGRIVYEIVSQPNNTFEEHVVQGM